MTNTTVTITEDKAFTGYVGTLLDPAYRVSGETVALVQITHAPDGHAVRNPMAFYFRPEQVEGVTP